MAFSQILRLTKMPKRGFGVQVAVKVGLVDTSTLHRLPLTSGGLEEWKSLKNKALTRCGTITTNTRCQTTTGNSLYKLYLEEERKQPRTRLVCGVGLCRQN